MKMTKIFCMFGLPLPLGGGEFLTWYSHFFNIWRMLMVKLGVLLVMYLNKNVVWEFKMKVTVVFGGLRVIVRLPHSLKK